MEKKLCLECGETISGRADKKFCSDDCRSTFNNRQNREKDRIVRRINAQLRHNRRVLAELKPSGKTIVREETLRTKGFHFDYFTHQYTTRLGRIYHLCYDQGYLLLPEGQYLLTRWEADD